MDKTLILTGLRANNDLHIGNYFGALKPLIDMAKNRSNEYEVNLFVPDLHSFTTPIDHATLQQQIMHNLRLFVAAGLPLDNESIHIYRQSYIPAHSELTWILDCFTGMGEMRRMTQFKEKSTKLLTQNPTAELHDTESRDITVGLFNYPVLMAADILLYGATYVPVGDDQSQHLEYARDIAERMNNRFGELFVIPKPVKVQHEFFGKDQGLRIRNLQNPSKKMSKSEESDKGIIFLGDDPIVAAKKIMSAETDSLAKIPDSLDFNMQPGLSNLLQILSLLKDENIHDTLNRYVGQNQYGPLKREVSEATKKFLEDYQARLSNVDDTELISKLERDERTLNIAANARLLKVQQAVGLRPFV
ncbi:MAG TPA: tryptophan--tRNA ligase [Candidatus Saccharimonadales bacterium]|nr:tryptophan--tRNA ligase [Candidatus Saccharimonadales bacterium]